MVANSCALSVHSIYLPCPTVIVTAFINLGEMLTLCIIPYSGMEVQ